MRRAGHRILVDALRRSKKARDEINPTRSLGGGDNGEPVERGDGGKVRRQRGNVVSVVKDGEVIACGKERGGALPEPSDESLGHRAGRRRAGWEIKRQEVAVARDRQGTGVVCL